MLTDRTFGSLVREEKPTKDLWGILDRHPKPMTFGAIGHSAAWFGKRSPRRTCGGFSIGTRSP